MEQAAHWWVYEFGGYRLDAGRRTLTMIADDCPIVLAPKVFDVTLYLVERAGALVPKAQLLANLWPGVVVEENNLTQAISILRRALGERHGARRYVATVPRRGYQFVADVTRVAPGRGTTPQDDGVAVLPLVDLGFGEAGATLARGLAQSIVHRLARSPGLRVLLPATSASRPAGARDLRRIGRSRDVRYVLDGSVQRSGARVRITVRLHDATDGRCVWSLEFDRTAVDVFDLEDDVSRRVARALCRSLAGDVRRESRRVAVPAKASPSAPVAPVTAGESCR